MSYGFSLHIQTANEQVGKGFLNNVKGYIYVIYCKNYVSNSGLFF